MIKDFIPDVIGMATGASAALTGPDTIAALAGSIAALICAALSLYKVIREIIRSVREKRPPTDEELNKTIEALRAIQDQIRREKGDDQ